MPICLSAKSLNFSYEKREKILKDISFNLIEGESLGIFGKNGAGKSTLMRLLATSLVPSSGALIFGEIDCFENLKNYRMRISWLAGEEAGFYSRLTGKENLDLFFNYRSVVEQYRSNLNLWLELESFRNAYKRPFYLCSSGMKQVLCLFRCLQTDANAYFLDEPTRYLDKDSKEFLVRVLKENLKKSIHIVTSHDEKFLDIVTTKKAELKNAQLSK